MNGSETPFSGAGGNGERLQVGHQIATPIDVDGGESKKPALESDDINRLSVADFVKTLRESKESREQIVSLLESLGKPAELRGEGEQDLNKQLKHVVEQYEQRSQTMTALRDQLNEAKKSLNEQQPILDKMKDDLVKWSDKESKMQIRPEDIQKLSNELVKMLDENAVSKETIEQLKEGKKTLEALATARTEMLDQLEHVAEKKVSDAVDSTNAEWQTRMDLISRMMSDIEVRRPRLTIVMPLIDLQSYNEVVRVLKAMEGEFTTWETKFHGLEIWCYSFHDALKLCRWPLKYDKGGERRTWPDSPNSGNKAPSQLPYPLQNDRIQDGREEKYLFILPLDTASDALSSDTLKTFPFPHEFEFDVVLVHDCSFDELRNDNVALASQMNSVQKSAGARMLSLSLLPSKAGQEFDDQKEFQKDFREKLQQLVRRSAVAINKMQD